MEKLFEAFLENSLKHAVSYLGSPYQVEAQVSKRYANPIEHSGRAYFTQPDDVLYHDATPRLVIDAKYKRLSDGDEGDRVRPKNADFYQMFAALVSHNCDTGLLIYPRFAEDTLLAGGNIRRWSVKWDERQLVIAAVAVDLGGLTSFAKLHDFDLSLADTLRRLI